MVDTNGEWRNKIKKETENVSANKISRGLWNIENAEAKETAGATFGGKGWEQSG